MAKLVDSVARCACDSWSLRLLALCLVAVGPGLHGQELDSVTVRGRVVEAGSGRPLPGQMVAVAGAWRPGWTTTDSSGAFSVRVATPDSLSLLVSCRVTRRPWGRTLGPFVHRDPERPVEIELPGGACREPPERSEHGTWSGHLSLGFEESDFEPCVPLPDLSDTAYGLEGAGVWADLSGLPGPAEWPRVPAEGGSVRYFVTVRGTRVGPGGYGHLGFSLYRIAVDSVLVARPPGPDDCAGPG
jgi:hypothetical protein